MILPAPSEIIEVIAARHDLLAANLWPSLYMTVLGFILSVVGGIGVGILITYSRDRAARSLPDHRGFAGCAEVSIAPLFIVWFGAGTISSLMLAFLVAFFPMTINAAMGFESVDEDVHKMARTFMGSPLADLLED